MDGSTIPQFLRSIGMWRSARNGAERGRALSIPLGGIPFAGHVPERGEWR